jgi:ParB family chromosome partitioning protein
LLADEEPEAALETSLIENTIRSAMHPADEFVAMASLIDVGEAIAVRFGVSERHVRHRLRLGKLAPELLDAYRAAEIGLEVVTAFTLGTDHAAQLAVWRQVKDNSFIQALHGAASADRDRRSARLPTRQLRRRRGL